jgi:hypothetical protein
MSEEIWHPEVSRSRVKLRFVIGRGQQGYDSVRSTSSSRVAAPRLALSQLELVKGPHQHHIAGQESVGWRG